jgi:hypothetical protein
MNWTELGASAPGAQELIDQYWFNADTGWICGYNVLLYTTDGGSSFVDMFSGIPPTGNGHNVLLAIQFVSHEVGWIGAGNLERTNIYKTTNAGTEWVFQDNPVSEIGWNQINDIRFISPDMGWAAHGTPGTGAIMFTSNGGTEWVMDNTQYSWYDCLSHDGFLTTWCGGSDGGVWYRTDSVLTHFSPVAQLPENFSLSQNYPNPFNGTSNFEFRLPAHQAGISPASPEGLQGRANLADVKLMVFDILGRHVATVVNERLAPGTYTRQWDAGNLLAECISTGCRQESSRRQGSSCY